MDKSYQLVEKTAKDMDWTTIAYQPQSSMISFKKEGVRINVYINKYQAYTVGTYLDHPTKGKTQLFRKCQNLSEVIGIFKNPRIHTGLGYYTK